jgi:hypothetical protein
MARSWTKSDPVPRVACLDLGQVVYVQDDVHVICSCYLQDYVLVMIK